MNVTNRSRCIFAGITGIIVGLGAITTAAHAGNIILNGSFESNSAGDTTYNLTNEEFNITVDDATAFGDREEIDLMTFGGGFGLDPLDGNWHLGISGAGESGLDAFSFVLSGAIVSGTEYDLSFWAAQNTSFRNGINQIEIGISSSADSFGVPVYTTPSLVDDIWTLYITSFIAPVDGDFLTVRMTDNDPNDSTWAHIDNFRLSVSGPSLATLTDVTVSRGTLLSGGLPEIQTSDDLYLQTRSGFGLSLVDLHSTWIDITANTTAANPTTLDISVEAHIDEPSGIAKLRLLDHNSGLFDTVASGVINMADSTLEATGVDATDYVDGGGDIVLRIEHVVFVPFLAFTFESFIDQVEIVVE